MDGQQCLIMLKNRSRMPLSSSLLNTRFVTGTSLWPFLWPNLTHKETFSVRAFINLEGVLYIDDVSSHSNTCLLFPSAAGTVGPELLFQATSEQMIEAYSRVPRFGFPPCEICVRLTLCS